MNEITNKMLEQILHNQLVIMSCLKHDNAKICDALSIITQQTRTSSLSPEATADECELAKRLDIKRNLQQAINDTKQYTI